MVDITPLAPFETAHVFLASQKLRSYFGYHKLLSSDDKKFHFKEEITHLKRFSVFEFEFQGELSVQHYSLDDAYVFHLPVNGYFLVNSGLEVIKVSPGQMFILSPDVTPHFKIPKGVQVLIIYVQRNCLFKYAREILQYQPKFDLVFPLLGCSEMAVSAIHNSILNILATNKLIDNQGLKTLYLKQAEPCLLTLLLSVIDNSFKRQLKLTDTHDLPLIIRTARTFMLENIAETIHLDDLCQASSVSKRRLIYQFKKYADETPMNYLLGLRLDMLRENLKQGQSPVNILEMAMLLGLNHPGRMAKNYKERFGELPSQTKIGLPNFQ